MYYKPLLKFDTNEFKPHHVSCLIANYVISYLNQKHHKRLELYTHLQTYVFYIFVKVLQKHNIYLFEDRIQRGHLNPYVEEVYSYFHIQTGSLRETNLIYGSSIREAFKESFVDINLANTILVNALQQKDLLETINSVIDYLQSLDSRDLINLYTSNPFYDIRRQHLTFTDDQLYDYVLEF